MRKKQKCSEDLRAKPQEFPCFYTRTWKVGLAAGSHTITSAIGADTTQSFSVAKNKWTFPKKGANPCGWKMSYKAKDGSAKGQFTVKDAAGKKVKYTVNGAVVGRTFYGTAFNKKAGSFAVVAE